MASRVSPPQRPIRHDGSRDLDIRLPDINEVIMARLPFEVTLGPPSIISTDPLTNADDANYHLCIVSGRVFHRQRNSIQLDVWVCLGFSSAVPDSHTFVRSLSAEWQECLLPVPYAPQDPHLDPLPTPAGFGEPLQLGGILARKPCYLNIKTVPIRLTRGTAFKRFHPPGIMSDEEATRLEIYALRVPRLTLPISYQHRGDSNPLDGNSSHPPLPTNDPGSHSPSPPSAADANTPTVGGVSSSNTRYILDPDDLLELWYPELNDMVCAVDMSSHSGESEEGGLDLLQYARLFAGTSPELRAVVDEHDAIERAARDQRVGSWLRATPDMVLEYTAVEKRTANHD